jgi:hypothetical protein
VRAERAGAGAAVALSLALTLLASGCGSSPSARPVRHTAPTAPAPTTTAPTTTLPSAVPTTVPTAVVPTVGWSHPATTLPPVGGYTGVSCISGVFCVAVGGGANEADVSDAAGPGVVTAWDGAVWGSPTVYYPEPAGGPTTAPELAGIACTSGPRCALVDGSGHASLGDGTDWSAPAALAGGPAVAANPADPGSGHEGARSAAVDCPTGQFCAYVDNTGHVAVLHGTTWSALQTMTTRVGSAVVGLFQAGRVGMSCTGASACTALVGDTVLDWDGATWTASPAPWPSATTGDSAVSCPAAGACVAVRGQYVSVRVGGPAWSTPRAIDAAGRLDGVSCPTPAFCMAVDADGDMVHLVDGTWSAPVKVVPTPTEYSGDGTSLSCPTDQFCMVLTGDGDYATYQGTDPNAPVTTTTVPVVTR